MLENITTYEEQEKSKRKSGKESVEASIAAEESSIADVKAIHPIPPDSLAKIIILQHSY